MSSIAKIAVIVAATLVVIAAGGAIFLATGMYDIGADDHHTKPVLALIEQLRDRSIAVRSKSIEVPGLDDPKLVRSGAQSYASLCVGCHLAPGVSRSDIRQGMYPHPPTLAQEEVHDPKATFWIVKHGIKMSAMPAWGKRLNDQQVWEVVAFIRNLPDMDAATYGALSAGAKDAG